MHNIKLLNNYVTNVEEILEEIYKLPKAIFKNRAEGSYKFSTLCKKGATMSTIMYNSFPPELKKACVKTVDFFPFSPPTEIAINWYPPGSYLGKHKDGIGRYWKFQLIFLKSTRSHFTWYDGKDNPHLVEEVPGSGLEMPLNIIHESTPLLPDEEDKYSMVFIWK